MQLKYLIKRNTKLFFKDKGIFLTSLITPVILLVLYCTFLGNVYKDSLLMGFPDNIIPDKIVNGFVGGQLFSSLLAVSCVTVSFCSNMISVQDKANGVRRDFMISPVKSKWLSLGYFISSLTVTLIICLCACAVAFIYLAFVGWYMTLLDVLLILADIFLLVIFGTALSSIVNLFLSSQGQISAVGTIVSSGYGFICGAYMPISQFSTALQSVIMLLPGTHATSLLRYHSMRGVIAEMENLGLSSEAIEELERSVDCKIFLFQNEIPNYVKLLVLAISAISLVLVYIFLSKALSKKKKK